MASQGPYFAALDFGTGGGKCVIFDATGKRLAAVREPWSYQQVSYEHSELLHGSSFDPHAFWAALGRCSHRAIAEARISPDAIAGVAATALRLGTVFLDARGREVYAAPNMDGRGLAGGFEVMEKLALADAIRITGHWPPFVFSLARLLRFRNLPDEPRVAYVLGLNDWITYRLSGALACEPSNAGESMLLDVTSRSWSREILDRFEIDDRILPPVVEPGTPLGRVTPEAAEQTGFAPGTHVFAGGADTQCALLGAGVVEPGHAGAVLGTTTPVMLVDATRTFDENGKLWTGCHVVPQRWTLESNAGDTGIAFEWLLSIVGLEGDDAFERAEALITAIPEGASPVMSFAGPQIFDLLNFDPTRPSAFLFDNPPFATKPTTGSFLRAFLGNVACAARANLEQIERHRAQPAASLTLTGGMTRLPSLLREFARTSRRPLRVSDEPHATALGAALLAAVGAGAHPSIADAAREMVRLRDVEPGLRDEGDAEYERWRKRYPELGKLSA